MRKVPVPALALAVIVVAHGAWLVSHVRPAVWTPDAHSYYRQARLVADTGRPSFVRESPAQFVGPHWGEGADGRYYSTHPPGFPILLAGAFAVGGPPAALAVPVLLTSLAILFLYLAVARWTGPWWAVFAAGMLAVNPVVIDHALFGDAHAAVLCGVTFVVAVLARWTRNAREGYGPPGVFEPALAGFVAGALPVIRYPEALYLPAVLLFVLLADARRRPNWRAASAAAAGAAVPLTALLIRNQAAYGAFWKTGYDLVNEADAVGLSWFVFHAPALVAQMLTEGPGLMLPLGIAGVWVWARRSGTRSRAWLTAGLVVPITLVYMSFYRPPDGQSMRFFLPSFPLYAIGTAAALAAWQARFRRSGFVAAVTCAALTALWGLPPSARMLAVHRSHNDVLAGATDFLAGRVPEGSVVVTGVGMAQQLDVAGRCRVADGSLVMSVPPDPNPPVPPPPESLGGGRGPAARAAVRHYRHEKAGDRYRAFAADVQSWAGGRDVYLFMKAADLRPWWNYLNRSDSLELVGEFAIPSEPATPGDRPASPPHPRLPAGDPFMPVGKAQDPPPPPLVRPPANQIFDLALDGRPLVLLRWTRM